MDVEGGRAKCGKSRARAGGGRQGGREERRWGARRVVCGEGGGEESTPKIGSNKLSTIFAGLNTLKRLEIRLAGGPFVHGAPCRPGMKDCNVLSRKRDESGVQLSEYGLSNCFSRLELQKYILYKINIYIIKISFRIWGEDSFHLKIIFFFKM